MLSLIFGKPEEINGDHRCPTYLYRWSILSTPWFKVYLHKFVGDDWTLDLHDHPKRFWSIGLRGGYLEEYYNPETERSSFKFYHAPWFRSFPPDHRHRLNLTGDSPCWTLVIVGPLRRDWGFWHEGRWIQWLEYVRGKGGPADKMKSCPD